MRVLVIGGSGKVGKALVSYLRASSQMAVDSPPRSEIDVTKEFTIAAGLDRHCPDVVINASALTNMERCEADPVRASAVNTVGPKLLAAECSMFGIPLIHFSTDYVFNGWQTNGDDLVLDHDPLPEEHPYDPIRTYGRTKQEGEVSVRDHCDPHLILRLSTIYDATRTGPLDPLRQIAERPGEVCLLPQTCTPTSVYFVAEQVARILVMTDGLSDVDTPYGTYHLVPNGQTTRKAFIERAYGRPLPPTRAFRPDLQRPLYSVLDNSKYELAFGGVMSWEDDLDRVLPKLAV